MIFKILAWTGVISLMLVGIFSSAEWDVRTLAILYSIANVVIYRGLMF